MDCPDCKRTAMVMAGGRWVCTCGAVQIDLETLRASAHVSAAAMLARGMIEPRPAATGREAPARRRAQVGQASSTTEVETAA